MHRAPSDSRPLGAGRGAVVQSGRERSSRPASRADSRRRGDGRVLAVAAVGSALIGLRACGRGDAAGAAAPHFVDDTASVRASTTATTASSSTSSAAASPRSTATTTGATSCSSPAAAEPAALYHNDSPIGGALRFSRAPVARHRPDRGRPAPTRSTSTATGTSTSSCSAAAATSCCAASVAAGSRTAGQAARARRAARAGPPRSAPRGRARTRLPTLAFGRYLVPGEDRCDESWLVRPDGDRRALRRADRARARLLHAVDAVQRLEPHRARATCGCRTTATTTSTARSSCGASQPGAAAQRSYTEADGWQPLQIWGMGIASQDLTGDGLPEVFLTSQADNKLQTLAAGATRPDYRDIALTRGCHRATAVRRRRRAAVDGVAPGVRRRQQRRPRRPARHQGQRRRADRPGDTRSEQPVHRSAGRLVRRRGRAGRDRRLPSGRAAPRSSTSTSTACSTWSSSTGERTPRCGATSVAATPSQAEADGPLDRRAAAAAGAERRRHRRVARRAGRRHARPRGR